MDPPKEDISNENEGEGSPKQEDGKLERKKQRGPTKKGKPKTKLTIKYNKRGVPIGPEAIELATFEGMVARTTEHFGVNLRSRKKMLQDIRVKWRSFKYTLNKHFVIPFADNRSKLVRPPPQYNFIRKSHWEKQETRLNEEEIDRSLTWKLARQRKGGGYDLEVAQRVEKISDLETKAKTGSLKTDGKNGILSQALGTKEHLGVVRDMEKFITHGVCFEIPKNVRDMMTREKDEFIKKPLKDNALLAKSVAVDNTCYLAVDSPANIMAKGTIIEYEGPNIWVTMDVVFDGSPSLPFPDDEEFLVKVSDAIGHRLLWPKELVLRAADVVSKKLQKKKYTTPKKVAKKSESIYNKVDSDMGIEDIDLVGNELAITPVKSEPKQMKLDKKHTSLGKRKADVTPLRKKKTRQLVVFEKHRVQNNPSLKMFSTMVNRLLPIKALYEKPKGNGGNVNEIDFISLSHCQ
ncbi:hypothetical protein Pint_07849 [Pistacia integerrima]|uniref:Uncharacterized protein n=1 Tax=Pistacia integerrima TaxID=434235 RepID=A0ACC0XVL6_9ROSI|nr:hypothetical protein Pint_07849 [Pistacia integerrima]